MLLCRLCGSQFGSLSSRPPRSPKRQTPYSLNSQDRRVAPLACCKTALAKGYGLASLDCGIPITPKSRFYITPVSKHFTATAALLAEREGRLSIDDPLSKYFPAMPEYAARITPRRMLDHTAGLRDYLTLWALKG